MDYDVPVAVNDKPDYYLVSNSFDEHLVQETFVDWFLYLLLELKSEPVEE